MVAYYYFRDHLGSVREVDDAQKLKGLERENAELKKMLAETLLENRALKIRCPGCA